MTIPIMHRTSGNFNDEALLALATTRQTILSQHNEGMMPDEIAYPLIDGLDTLFLGTRATSGAGIACKVNEVIHILEVAEEDSPFIIGLLRSILADVETLGRTN